MYLYIAIANCRLDRLVMLVVLVELGEFLYLHIVINFKLKLKWKALGFAQQHSLEVPYSHVVCYFDGEGFNFWFLFFFGLSLVFLLCLGYIQLR